MEESQQPMDHAPKHPGAGCPGCGCRHCPVRFTRYSGRRTIRARTCRNCGQQFREVAVAIAVT